MPSTRPGSSRPPTSVAGSRSSKGKKFYKGLDFGGLLEAAVQDPPAAPDSEESSSDSSDSSPGRRNSAEHNIFSKPPGVGQRTFDEVMDSVAGDFASMIVRRQETGDTGPAQSTPEAADMDFDVMKNKRLRDNYKVRSQQAYLEAVRFGYEVKTRKDQIKSMEEKTKKMKKEVPGLVEETEEAKKALPTLCCQRSRTIEAMQNSKKGEAKRMEKVDSKLKTLLSLSEKAAVAPPETLEEALKYVDRAIALENTESLKNTPAVNDLYGAQGRKIMAKIQKKILSCNASGASLFEQRNALQQEVWQLEQEKKIKLNEVRALQKHSKNLAKSGKAEEKEKIRLRKLLKEHEERLIAVRAESEMLEDECSMLNKEIQLASKSHATGMLYLQEKMAKAAKELAVTKVDKFEASEQNLRPLLVWEEGRPEELVARWRGVLDEIAEAEGTLAELLKEYTQLEVEVSIGEEEKEIVEMSLLSLPESSN